MPKITFYLPPDVWEAFTKLAASDYRDPRAELAIIIRRELEQRGFIEREETERDENADESGN